MCKYVIVMCTCIGDIHLLAIMCFLKKNYTTMSECMIFYGPIVPEINYSSSSSSKGNGIGCY